MLILTFVYMKYLRKDEEKITKMEEKGRRDGWETEVGRSHFCYLLSFFVFELWLPYLCIYINCKSFWPALYGRWCICCIQKIKDPVGITRMHSPNRTAWKWHQKIVFCLICILEYHWVQETRGICRELKALANYCHLWNTGTWQTPRRRSVKQREHRLSGCFWDTRSVGTIDLKGWMKPGHGGLWMQNLACTAWFSMRQWICGRTCFQGKLKRGPFILLLFIHKCHVFILLTDMTSDVINSCLGGQGLWMNCLYFSRVLTKNKNSRNNFLTKIFWRYTLTKSRASRLRNCCK